MSIAKTEKLRGIIAEMTAIRADVRANLDALAKNDTWSDTYKLHRRVQIIDEAQSKLEKLGEMVDDSMPDFTSLTAAAERFDYSDARLAAAVQLIRTMKSALPETAYKAMIKDFENRPAMLKFLADTFEKNDATAAAVAASEEAKEASYWTGLPRLVSDEVFYASRTNPADEVDFSGTLAKLDRLDEIGEKMTVEAVEGNTVPA